MANKSKNPGTIVWLLFGVHDWSQHNSALSGFRFFIQPYLCFMGMAILILLNGCFGPSKIALSKQFDSPIGHNKDLLITELGLPTNECTPLKIGEACEWVQTGGAHFLEGPLDGTFPGDKLTYFIDSKGIVCQWRFLGARNGTQHSASRCQ